MIFKRIIMSLKDHMSLNNNYFSTLLITIIILNIQNISGFMNLPKIVTKDGNLMFYSGQNRNVSFLLHGNSRLKINDDIDLLDLLMSYDKKYGNKTQLHTCDNNVLWADLKSQFTDIKNTVYGKKGLSNSVYNIQQRTSNNKRKLGKYKNRLQKLEITIRDITSRVNKDNCESNPCQNGGTCFSLFNKFVCKCTNNFEGQTCEKDVNECALFDGTDLGCQNGGQCVNQHGGYSCICNPGWYGKHCTKRQNDCSQSSSWELCGHGICVVSPGHVGYKCICDQGWTKDNLSPSCNIDVDECQNGTTSCITKCINLPGSFKCAPCDNGLTGNGISCRDINECEVNNGGCSINPLVPCINSYGSYHCGDCPYGWAGDGRTCTRSDNDNSPIGTPCKINGLCHPAASCSEISNSIVCTCPAGMVGNGMGPDGCVQAPHTKCDSKPCLNGGNCIDTVNGYTCACPRGFLQPNCAVPASPCSPNPCQNNASCREKGTSDFQCICLPRFHGRLCELKSANSCGGVINAELGKLKYPPYAGNYGHSVQCAWVLRTNSSKVLNVTFNQFEIEHSRTCSFDWLQINDGPTAGSQIIGRFCGTQKPQGGNIISTTSELYFWFKSDNSTAKEGFELEWKSIPPQCGGIINITTHGTISSPGSPGKYPRSRDCVWQLRAPNTKRIKLTFFSLKLEKHATCNFDYLEITDAISNIELEKYCTTSNPPPLLLSTNEADIRFHSDEDDNDFGFQIFYSTQERIPGCGGIFNDIDGTIMSPAANSDEAISCEYEIHALTNESIKIEFSEFDLIADNCIEIYNVNEIKGETVLEIKYCGNYGFTIPNFHSIYNKVLIKYFTRGGHFELNYRRDCSYTFERNSDIIISPEYSSSRHTVRSCTLKILTEPGSVIELNIIDFDIFDPSGDNTTCNSLSYLKMKNGLSGEEYGPYCGNNTPPNENVILSNLLILEYATSNYAKGRGFKIAYKSLPMESTECGGVYTKSNDKIRYLSTAPTTTSFITTLDICYFIIMAPSSKYIAINWEYFDVADCSSNSVEIYENVAENSKPLGIYCIDNKPPNFISHSRILTLKLQSESSYYPKSFEASYAFVDKFNCGGTILSGSGELTTPNWPLNYTNNMDCTWIINAPISTQIELKFEWFDLVETEDCSGDWLSIRNGGSNESVLIGTYCGKSVPRAVPSFTNQLRLHFHTDGSQTASGFRLSWQVFSNRCGGVLKGETGVITSPFYPNAYPNNIECEWYIHVKKGSSIHIQIEKLELENPNQCYYDYLQITDGRNQLGKQWSKICQPLDFITTQSEAVVRFVSDISVNKGGFLMSYYANCTRILNNNHGIIESPNYDEKNYKNNINCSWTIKAPRGNQIHLEFTYVDEKNKNSSIYIINPRNGTSQEIKSIQTFVSNDDSVIIMQNSSLISFRLEYSIVGCVGLFRSATGTFNSPNYPNAYKNDQECFWEIQVSPDKSIELIIAELDIEESVNCTKDYLQISHHPESISAKERHCGRATNLTISSSGSILFVSFKSNTVNNAKGFVATYREVDTKCGGLLKAKNGVITSPNYPLNYAADAECEWTITVSSAHRIGITFEELDLEEFQACEGDFVEAYEVQNENERVLFHLCGSAIPNNSYYETISSTVIIRFQSDESMEAKGFKLTFTELCGMDFIVEDDQYFEFAEAPGNKDCLYRFMAKNPSERIMLLITHVNMNSIAATQYHSEEDCQHNGVKIFEGTNITNTVRASFCKIHPETIYSNGHALTMQIPTKIIAEMEGFYMMADSFCGGYYNALNGKFSSPYYPTAYSVNMDCEWYISANSGNSIVLTIESLDLEESEYCNKDFLEIRNKTNRGKLLGTFCGKEPPPPIMAEELWIRFRSDNDIVSSGFMASYNFAEHNEISGSYGTIESPRYPSPLYSHMPYSWRISVDRSSRIFLNIRNIIDAVRLTIKIYDGYSDIGLPIDISNKNLIKSSSNILYFTAERGPFSFEWEAIDKLNVNKTDEEIAEKCGNSIIIDDKNNQFNSPGYPYGYENLLQCQWKFISKNPLNHININFNRIDMEDSYDCMMDYLQISASNDLNNWHVLEKICAMPSIGKSYVGTPYLMLTFVTDVSGNGTGFSANIQQACGSELTESRGVLNLTDLISKNRKLNECIWTIRVRQSRRIRIKFLQSNINEPSNNVAKQCKNYIIIRNGISIESPFLGQGKYCNNDITDILETSGNRAYIKLVYLNGKSDIVLHYEEVLNECSDEIILNDESFMDRSTIITSPNYPNLPNPHSECIWIIKAPVQHSISINFVGKFDLAPISTISNETCLSEYIQLNDGATELMPLIGQYCGDIKPNSVITSSNILRVKYMTDITEPHLGFKMNVSISTCGGSYYSNEDIIKSPTNLGLYSDQSNFECVYIIDLPRGNTIDIIIKASLPYSAKCKNNTHLELQEIEVIGDKDNITDSLLLCGSFESHYTVETNKLILRYRVKELANNMFEIKYKSISSLCGETIEATRGIIESPGYPDRTPQYLTCLWRLRVPKGRRIKVEILDFEVENRNYSSFSFHIGKLTFYNDFNSKSKITRIERQSQKYIYSSDNTMTIELILYHPTHRGVKLRFTSNDDSMCNYRFNLVRANNTPQKIVFNMTEVNKTPYYCNFNINVPSDKTVALHFTQFTLVHTFFSHQLCVKNRPIIIKHRDEEILKKFFCQNETSPTARVAFPITMELFGANARNMTVEYQVYNCGGVINKRNDVLRLEQPQFADNYTGRVECVWSIFSEIEPGEPTSLFEINLKTNFNATCDKQYLKIYNGPRQSSPLLEIFCASSSATNLVVQHGVLIEYYSEKYEHQSNFSLDLREGELCGGKISYPYRKIYFHSLYRNNMECIWDIATEPGFHIGLYFEDRFFIESSKDCTKDYLLVQQKTNNGDWEDINRFCGREPPTSVNTTSPQMRLIFRSDNQTTGDGFIAAFERNCGGIFYATKDLQQIKSVGYPLEYQNNLLCNYTIIHADANSTDLLNVRFLDFALEKLGLSTCKFDYVNVKVFSSPDVIESEKKYCGNDQQMEFRAQEKIELIFHTDEVILGKGFLFEYTENKCGGVIQKPSIISTPKHNNNNFPDLSQCYWNITAPPTDKIILKFEILDFENNNLCPYDGVEIFKGLIPNETARVAKLCGNFTGNMPILSIPTNTALIHGYSDSTYSSRGFEVIVNFVPNCDKTLFLDINNSTYDLNTFTQATNTNISLDCNYIFTTLPGRQLVVEIRNFNFKTPTNSINSYCNKNYLEIRDGVEPFSDEIGKFCESYLQKLTTSANGLFMRFVHDDTSIGFQAHIQSVPTLCGQHDIQLIANVTLTIRSPDNGAGLYPNNIYCFWKIKSENPIKILFEKLEIDTNPSKSNGSCGGDYLKINSLFKSENEDDVNERNIYRGDFNSKDPLDNAAEHIFCGNIIPHDYYSNSKEVIIRFKTDAEYAKSGFILKLSQVNHCLRNYTALQGRVLISGIDDYCDVYIKAPTNYSLSLYFSNIDYFDYICGEDYLQVFDSHSNKSLEKICTYYDQGKSIFTTTNELHLHLHSKMYYGKLDFTFLASNQGPGCGGDLFNTAGIITSPFYPNDVRNNSDCRWNIKVPSNVVVLLRFEEFQFGVKNTCKSDYLQISEYDDNIGQEVIQRQFCGEDRPYTYKSMKSSLSIRFHKTVNFDGTGFVITFKGVYANYEV